jgi:IS30 family transposase
VGEFVVAGSNANVIAQRSCQQRWRAGRSLAKLHTHGPMFEVVPRLLGTRWSPEQMALTRPAPYAEGHEYRVSIQATHNCIYAQHVGEFKREQVACLLHAHNEWVPRSKGQDRRGQTPDMLSAHVCPPEVDGLQFPVKWEANHIRGEGNASAANALQAFTCKLLGIPVPLRQSMAYDQGQETAKHKDSAKATRIAVYCCGPYSPWQQRGTNKYRNGLLRQYLPKGTDLSGHSHEQLNAIADEINNRPRNGLGLRSPPAVHTELLMNSPRHAPPAH